MNESELIRVRGQKIRIADRAAKELADVEIMIPYFYELWLTSRKISEINDPFYIDYGGAYKDFDKELVKKRQSITRVLRECSVGQWISYQTFLELLHTREPVRSKIGKEGGRGSKKDLALTENIFKKNSNKLSLLGIKLIHT